jgi:serine/threonine protein kinase
MRIDELRRLRDLLARDGEPDSVFMSLRDRSLQGPQLVRALGDELRRWRTIASPERYGGNPEAQDLAKQLQRRLDELHAEALRRVDSAAPAPPPESAPGLASADRPLAEPAPRPPGLRVEIGGEIREFPEHLADGDLAALWRAPGGDGEPCVAKVAHEALDNDLLFVEAEVLPRLHAEGARQSALLPRLHGRFFTADGRAGNLLGLVEGLDGLALRERLPGGVPPEHIIWIGRRLLSALGHAHRAGVLHGNIEPAHVIVRPRDHRVVLVDWCYAIVEPARTGQGFRAVHDDYSAPEVAQRGPATPAADLFSVGRTLAFLLGGDPHSLELPAHVPERIARFVRYLARPSRLQRAQDAWEMFAELDRIREVVYGPHVFREFVV